MSTVLFEQNVEQNSLGQRLRELTTGIVLKMCAWSITVSVKGERKERMANATGTDAKRVRVSKYKINPDESPAYKRCRAIQTAARDYWTDVTTPHVDPGVRCGRVQNLDQFREKIEDYQAQLREAAQELNAEMSLLRAQAAADLSELYEPSDYPVDVSHEWSIEWETRSLEIDDSWKELHPELYQAEIERANAKLEQCVRLAEQEFADQFAVAVEKICQGLNGDEDGEKKRIGPSHFKRLNEFIDRFRTLNLGSNEELERLADRAQAAIRGVDEKKVKRDASVAGALQKSMNDLANDINGMMTAKPKRRIELKKKTEAKAAA